MILFFLSLQAKCDSRLRGRQADSLCGPLDLALHQQMLQT
jgi:hypothetical protein